jgi:hypothetical protein
MNSIRVLMSVFILILITLSVAGWIWAGGQPSPQSMGSRVALTAGALAGVMGLVAIWRAPQTDSESGHA